MHAVTVAFSIVAVVFVGGVVLAAWLVRALLYRKARAAGWTPPASRGMSGGYYGPDGQFYPVDNGGHQGGHHGGHDGGGFFGGGGGHHGGGGGGGDAGGGGHHH